MLDIKLIIPLLLSIAAVVFAALGMADKKIDSAIKSAQDVRPPAVAPVYQNLKCDTIIRISDTIFIFSKNKDFY